MADTPELSRSQRRLLRIAYIALGLLLLVLFLVGTVVAHKWFQKRDGIAQNMEDSRTHEGALHLQHQLAGDQVVADWLASLPPPNALHGNGMRFIDLPSLGIVGPEANFAIAVFLSRPDARDANTVLNTVRRENDKYINHRIEFRLPAAAYRSFMSKFDHLTDNWPGDGSNCMDGNPVAFERIRGNRITSGYGNASCSPNYHELNLLVSQMVEKFSN